MGFIVQAACCINYYYIALFCHGTLHRIKSNSRRIAAHILFYNRHSYSFTPDS